MMELFDRQDKEDDYQGVPQGSRTELEQVTREIYQQQMKHRFFVIFHNGSNEEIDLASLCGFALSGYSTNKVLWTFQGRFRLKPRAEIDTAMKSTGTTDTFFSALPGHGGVPQAQLWSYLVQKEASEVAETCKINTGPRGVIVHPEQVAECFLYLLRLCCRGGHHSIDYNWATHGANYWICDGIIMQQLQQGHDGEVGDDGLWRAAEAIQSEVLLDAYYHQYLPSSPLARFVESKPCWSSPNYGFNEIPGGAAIPNGDMFFQHCFDKLRVLKLSWCTFSIQSPPFLCCHSLRFLWLDHCQDTGNNDTDTARIEEDVRRCFQRLWVLVMHNTKCDQILSAQMLDLMTQLRELIVMGAQDWDMGQLHGRLPNIRKLRITNSDGDEQDGAS